MNCLSSDAMACYSFGPQVVPGGGGHLQDTAQTSQGGEHVGLSNGTVAGGWERDCTSKSSSSGMKSAAPSIISTASTVPATVSSKVGCFAWALGGLITYSPST